MALIDINLDKEKRYDVILTDPPWKQSKGGKKKARPQTSGEQLDYPTLTLEDIKNYQSQVIEIAEPNHACFMWTIDKYLHESEKMMLDLGYKLHARMIWNKVTGIPAAFTVRFGHEYLLWFYKGTFTPIEKSMRGKIHTVFVEQVKKHSQKPEISFDIINSFYPDANKLEMYARKERNGWDCWGNEVG